MESVTHYPSSVVSDSGFGTVAWSNPSNAAASDNAYATVTTGDIDFSYPTRRDARVRLVKADGTVGSTDKALGTNLGSSDAVREYGDDDDLWGETLTPADINDADFGFVVAYYYENPNDAANTRYLKATGFSFAVPADATILGIKAKVEAKAVIVATIGYTLTISVDSMAIEVFYEPAPTIVNDTKHAAVIATPDTKHDAVSLSNPSKNTVALTNVAKS